MPPQISNVGPAAFPGYSSFSQCGAPKFPLNRSADFNTGGLQRAQTAPSPSRQTAAQRRLYAPRGSPHTSLRDWHQTNDFSSKKNGSMAQTLKMQTGKDPGDADIHKAVVQGITSLEQWLKEHGQPSSSLKSFGSTNRPAHGGHVKPSTSSIATGNHRTKAAEHRLSTLLLAGNLDQALKERAAVSRATVYGETEAMDVSD